MRILRFPGYLCVLVGLGVPAIAADNQTSTATSAPTAEFDLRVNVLEFTGPLDSLKGSTLPALDAEIKERRKVTSEAAQARTPWRARRAGSRPASGPAEQGGPRRPRGRRRDETSSVQLGGGAQLVLHVPNEGTSRAIVASRVPFAETPTDQAGRGLRVSYGEVGVKVEIRRLAEPGDPPGAIVLQMKLEAALASLAGDKQKPQKLEKKISISPERAVLLPIDDEPVTVGESGAGRWRAVSLELVDSSRKAARSREPLEGGEVSKEPGTRLQLDCLQVTIENKATAEIDLHKLTEDAPSASELMKRLKEWGDPIQSYSTEISFDSGKAIDLLAGQRAPAVQDVHVSAQGVVTPSVTYEEVGTIARIGPLKWEKDGSAGFKATGNLRLEKSGIAPTAVEVSRGVRLPSFSQWKVDESCVFRSGVPNYFMFRGPPTPPTPDGSVNLYVARLVITRPGE